MEKKVLIAIYPLAKPVEVEIPNMPDIAINFIEIEDIFSQETFIKLTQPVSKLNWNFLVVVTKIDVKINELLMQQLLKYMVFDHQAGIIDFGQSLPMSSDNPESVQEAAAMMIDSAIGSIIQAPSPKANQIPPTTQILKEIMARIASSVANQSKSYL